jgi:hypothetical protein
MSSVRIPWLLGCAPVDGESGADLDAVRRIMHRKLTVRCRHRRLALLLSFRRSDRGAHWLGAAAA